MEQEVPEVSWYAVGLIGERTPQNATCVARNPVAS